MNRFDIRRQLLNGTSPSAPRKTRYDWDAILAKYPRAKAATTDKDGRADLWPTRIRAQLSTIRGRGVWEGYGEATHLCIGGYLHLGETPDWEDSFEERPR